jgi:hypothetical protein
MTQIQFFLVLTKASRLSVSPILHKDRDNERVREWQQPFPRCVSLPMANDQRDLDD